MNEKRRIRILIVDDHAVVRSGLRTILETEPDIEIVGEAGDGHAALELAQELLPDVVLMDINMGDWDGVTATRRVRNYVPSARVIVLTNYDEDDLGFSLIYPSVARRVLDEFGQLRASAPNETDVYSDLTPREREVLRLVASGRANKEIGAQLGITERTVKTHISNIFSKLELTDRTQAALFVHNRGMLEKDSAR
jgi:NarL family two-component system response regulator LiaR